MLDEIQRGERFFGVGMILSKDLRSFGPASAMYLLWKAMPDDFTALAKMPSDDSWATNFSTDAVGPEICTIVNNSIFSMNMQC